MSGHYLIAAGEAQSRAAGIRAISQYKDFVDATRNTVMNDPFQFERMEQGAANVINDPKGIFAHIPSDKRDELARTTKTEIAKSAVQGIIRLDPRIAMQQLTGDKWDPVSRRRQQTRFAKRSARGDRRPGRGSAPTGSRSRAATET
jgi:hypothetical protein